MPSVARVNTDSSASFSRSSPSPVAPSPDRTGSCDKFALTGFLIFDAPGVSVSQITADLGIGAHALEGW